MVLYHLHNPTLPLYPLTCNICHREISDVRYSCEICDDFDLCKICYDTIQLVYIFILYRYLLIQENIDMNYMKYHLMKVKMHHQKVYMKFKQSLKQLNMLVNVKDVMHV